MNNQVHPSNAVLQANGLSPINPMVILLAEDDVQIRYFIWKLLKTDGFTVLASGNGEFALKASRDYSGPIDLLLTDMEMPGMSGLELCRNILAERPGIKALVMSGDLQWRDQAVANGLPFLQKPFTGTVLRHSLEALLCPVPCEWTYSAAAQALEPDEAPTSLSA
jgi:two-component system cell cycle sensor histidine kinase/response regulator CckA